jgi:aspartate/methionine/tyrosine aminotransferase
MSKTYGLPGLRIGWIATRNGRLLDKLATLKDYTTICNSAPSEFLAELALRHRSRITERNLGIIRHNLELLDGLFADYADRVSWQRPQAGTMAFPRLLIGEVEAFCTDLIRSYGVLLLPGTAYGDHENHFRIGFGRKNMPQALGLLAEFLDSAVGAG